MSTSNKLILVGAAGMMLAIVLPPTRVLVWYVLPLGSGWDDLLFIVCAVVATALIVHNKFRRPDMEWWQRNRYNFYIVLIPVAVLILLLILMLI